MIGWKELLIYLLIYILVNHLILGLTYRSAKKINLKQAIEEFQTGDIFLSGAYNNQMTASNLQFLSPIKCLGISLYKIFYKALLGTNWTHAGLIFQIKGELYLYETVENDQTLYNYLNDQPANRNCRLVKLEEKLDKYCGICAIAKVRYNKKNIKKNVSTLNIDQVKNLLNKIDRPFQIDFHQVLSGIFTGITLNNKNKNNIICEENSNTMCSEQVYTVLKELGLVKGKLNGKQILPHNLNNSNLDLNDCQIDKPIILIK